MSIWIRPGTELTKASVTWNSPGTQPTNEERKLTRIWNSSCHPSEQEFCFLTDKELTKVSEINRTHPHWRTRNSLNLWLRVLTLMNDDRLHSCLCFLTVTSRISQFLVVYWTSFLGEFHVAGTPVSDSCGRMNSLTWWGFLFEGDSPRTCIVVNSLSEDRPTERGAFRFKMCHLSNVTVAYCCRLWSPSCNGYITMFS
jgi:hypothetical protein